MERVSTKIRELSRRMAFNKYNPSELIGQAIKLFEEEQYGTGDEGHGVADRLRDIARDAFRVWNERER